eukprot:TRINITY_DN3967_c0_g3_i1.p1 TRINITY_DN3967_c0_g3~~TRINITY_DN3967_c0_g3_i1.p1  ORF type:complete len:200 (+),score=18.18 TRINITY_DN3967_c0_g3_i1:90-689(+)
MSFSLPDEILREICLKCDIHTVCAIARTSKAINERVQDEYMWKRMCTRDGFTHYQAELSDWRAFYIESYCNPLRGKYIYILAYECDFDMNQGEAHFSTVTESYKYNLFHGKLPFLAETFCNSVQYLFVSVNALYRDCPVKALILVAAHTSLMESYVMARNADSRQQLLDFLKPLQPLRELSKLAKKLNIKFAVNSDSFV